MAKLAIAFAIFLACSVAAEAQYVQNWNNSPMNYQNSPMNFDNSPMNFKNSPMNFQNSPMNFGATNGVYDNSGNRVGYGVARPDGGMNYFTNDGRRFGYTAGQ